MTSIARTFRNGLDDTLCHLIGVVDDNGPESLIVSPSI